MNFKMATFLTDLNDFLVFKHVIKMRAKSLGINCIIVKTIVHLNTVCLNINRFSTFYQEILV